MTWKFSLLAAGAGVVLWVAGEGLVAAQPTYQIEGGKGFQSDPAILSRDIMPPVIGFVGERRICDNRRPDGPCWIVPPRQTIYESAAEPLERLSNTACAPRCAQDCKPVARLRYCESTTGCHIFFTEATDLAPLPQSTAAKPPPACASIHVNGQSACDIHP
jgi:hypothetical protein